MSIAGGAYRPRRQPRTKPYLTVVVTAICLVALCLLLVVTKVLGFSQLIQGIVYGFSTGSLYVLMALGMTLLFGMMNIVNFAHGEVYMLGAFTVYYLFGQSGLPYAIAVIAAGAVTAVFGLLVERVIYRQLENNEDATLVAFLGLSMLVMNLGWPIFGTAIKSVPVVFPGIVRTGFVSIGLDRLSIIPIAAVLLLAVGFLLRRTRYGKAMRAVIQDSGGASLQGINVNSIKALAFMLSFALAGVAGALAAPLAYIAPSMGFTPLLMSMIIIILGGLGSLTGAIVGGIAIGIFQSIATIVVGPNFGYMLMFIFILLFLVFKPAGLFGHE